MKQLEVGSHITVRELRTATNQALQLPAAKGTTHLQFRRYAGCPICNLHLRSIVQRHTELQAAGVAEIVVFHSSAQEIARYAIDLPFPVIADPSHELYDEFGVARSLRALAHHEALAAAGKGLLAGGPVNLSPGLRSLGVPADFLIAPDGLILAANYGAHAYDQWSVDEVLERLKQQ